MQQGEEISITLRGKPIARNILNYTEVKRDAALKRLEVLRSRVGVILGQLDEQ